MCRVLPSHANLEHLRNQAKDLLARMQRDNPAAQLADAQHALARDYGFASWPRLKVHVESLVPTPLVATASPLAGIWVANVPQSRQHPANRFRSATIRIEVAGDSVTFTQASVGESGDPDRSKHTILADGVAREFASGYALTAAWRGPNVIETVATREGQPSVGGRYEVSADGETLVVTDSASDQRLVLDRSRA